eukprot:70420_1
MDLPWTLKQMQVANRTLNHKYQRNVLKRRGYYCSKTQEWSVRCVLDECPQSILQLLFKANEKGEIALIEDETNRFNKAIAYWIKSYFEDTDEISDLDCKYAGYALLYLREKCWHIHKLIVSKCR